MRNSYLFLLFFLSLFLACGSAESEDIQLNDSLIMAPGDMNSSFEGNFISDAHPTSGMVNVNTAMTTISFNNFMTDDGPKLLVYLSTSVDSADFVNLGDLKGTKGNYTYSIPSNTNLTKYKYVVIWCVDFLVSFGHAELK